MKRISDHNFKSQVAIGVDEKAKMFLNIKKKNYLIIIYEVSE